MILYLNHDNEGLFLSAEIMKKPHSQKKLSIICKLNNGIMEIYGIKKEDSLNHVKKQLDIQMTEGMRSV